MNERQRIKLGAIAWPLLALFYLLLSVREFFGDKDILGGIVNIISFAAFSFVSVTFWGMWREQKGRK